MFGLKIWLLSSCSGPHTLEDLRCEGESQVKKLTAELRAIQNREDLQKSVPRLKKRFNEMADLLLEAQAFPKKETEMSEVGEELFLELARLYEWPGGRELIESAQNEAVRKIRSGH